MCFQRLMKLSHYGQNLVLLDQDEIHVLSTFCFQLKKYKKHYHMVIFRGATAWKSIPECWIIGAQVLGLPWKFCENGKVMQPILEMPSWRILCEGVKASGVWIFNSAGDKSCVTSAWARMQLIIGQKLCATLVRHWLEGSCDNFL
jgi:hypothetical protein